MKRIKLNFKSYSDYALLALCQACILALTGNLNFPTTSPALAILQTLVNDYQAALAAAAEGGKTNVQAKKAKKKELVTAMLALAINLMDTAQGDELKLTSTGLPLTKTRTPLPPIGIPVIVTIENGAGLGELDIAIKKVIGALLYVFQYTQDPLTADSEWLSQNSTSIRTTLTGLESGKKYWIRVIAYGSADQMTMSDPALSRIVQ